MGLASSVADENVTVDDGAVVFKDAVELGRSEGDGDPVALAVAVLAFGLEGSVEFERWKFGEGVGDLLGHAVVITLDEISKAELNDAGDGSALIALDDGHDGGSVEVGAIPSTLEFVGVGHADVEDGAVFKPGPEPGVSSNLVSRTDRVDMKGGWLSGSVEGLSASVDGGGVRLRTGGVGSGGVRLGVSGRRKGGGAQTKDGFEFHCFLLFGKQHVMLWRAETGGGAKSSAKSYEFSVR